MAKNDGRFVKSEKQSLGFGENSFVLVDTKTGVNYLFVVSGYAGGLTPLLDREGKPVITSTFELKE